MSDIMGCSEMVGANVVIIAISTLAGYNQEDAVILNASSVQRGLFACTYYTILKETLQKNPITGEEEQFYKPTDEQVVNKSQCYDKITETGFPKLGTLVGANDVVISKYMPNRGGGARRQLRAAHERARHRRPSSPPAPATAPSTATATLRKVRLRSTGSRRSATSCPAARDRRGRSACWCPRTTCSSPTESSQTSSSTRTPTPVRRLISSCLRIGQGVLYGRWAATAVQRDALRGRVQQLADCGFDTRDEVMYDPAPAAS
jgi:DNA-directed RNA polymerase beta subunit